MAVTIGLLCFGLWPLLDPKPELIFEKFFLQENVGKFGGGSYLRDLFIGGYTGFRVWFGPITNAGLLALPVIYLALSSFRQRKVLMNDEKALWIMVLSYVLMFTLPTQRQENYVLPVMPALAVLLAMQWNRINRGWFVAFQLPLVLAAVLIGFLMFVLAAGDIEAIHYAAWHPVVPVLVFVSIAASFFWLDLARYIFPASVLLLYLSFGVVLAPFDSAIGKYDEQVAKILHNKTVYVPSNFRSKYEQHRFVLPGADIRGYIEKDEATRKKLIAQGEVVAIRLPINATIPDNYLLYGQRLVVRSRLNSDELYKILFRQRTDVMLRREILVQLKAVG